MGEIGEKVKMAMQCEILETFIEFPANVNGWHKELNLVKWGDNAPRYDLRSWNEDRSKMGKGLTFSKEELELLRTELNRIAI